MTSIRNLQLLTRQTPLMREIGAMRAERSAWDAVYDSALSEVSKEGSAPDFRVNDLYMSLLMRLALVRRDSGEFSRLEGMQRAINKERGI